MKKIIDYKICSEATQDELTKDINKLMKLGYEPYGNISTIHIPDINIWFTQPMVKYEDKKASEQITDLDEITNLSEKHFNDGFTISKGRTIEAIHRILPEFISQDNISEIIDKIYKELA